MNIRKSILAIFIFAPLGLAGAVTALADQQERGQEGWADTAINLSGEGECFASCVEVEVTPMAIRFILKS